MDTGYMVNLPYPQISDIDKNPHNAKIILQNYAGVVSELSAVTQYINHEQRLFNDYPDISDALLNISMVEMHHLQILGKLSVELGADLKFGVEKKNKYHPWTSRNIVYGKTAQSMIKADIASEHDAILQYQKSIKQIDDEKVNSILKRIILDEQLHIKILTAILDKYFSSK